MAIAHKYVPVPPRFGGGRFATAKSVTADCGPISANMDQYRRFVSVCVSSQSTINPWPNDALKSCTCPGIHTGISERNRIQAVIRPQPKSVMNVTHILKAILIQAPNFLSTHNFLS